jgi:hypothetical protein
MSVDCADIFSVMGQILRWNAMCNFLMLPVSLKRYFDRYLVILLETSGSPAKAFRSRGLCEARKAGSVLAGAERVR